MSGSVPRYDMRRLVATAGMGRVWAAHDTVLDRDVAARVNDFGIARAADAVPLTPTGRLTVWGPTPEPEPAPEPDLSVVPDEATDNRGSGGSGSDAGPGGGG